MSKRGDRERRQQEYSMYSLFSTNERAQKRAQRKQKNADTEIPEENRYAGQTGNGSRPAFRRPVGSSQAQNQTPLSRERSSAPSRTNTGASPKSDNGQARTMQSKSAGNQTHRYRMRPANGSLHRPHYDTDQNPAKHHDSQALFMVKSDRGRKVLVRDTGVSDLHAVRVPPTLEIKTFKEKGQPFPVGTLLSLLLVTAMIMAMIYSYVKKSELTADNAAKDDELIALKNEEEDLSLQIVKRSDLKDIESKAENDLGMVKNDQQERQYIAIEGRDHAKVFTSENEDDIPVQTVILQ